MTNEHIAHTTSDTWKMTGGYCTYRP